MKTQLKNQLFRWMRGFDVPGPGKRAARRMFPAILLITVLPCAGLHAATPPNIGTSFPMYVTGLVTSDPGGASGIIKLDSSGAPTSFGSAGALQFPCGAAFDGSGNLFTVNNCLGGSEAPSIVKLDVLGNPTVFASGGNLAQPFSLAFDASGNLYVGDAANGSIVKLDSQGSQTVVITPFTNFASIRSIAFDSNGTMYVSAAAADISSGIYRLGTTGIPSRIATTGPPTGTTFSVFTGLAFDANGSLFAAQYTETGQTRTGGVFKIDNAGNLTTFSSGGNIVNPFSMAFDATGSLYVVTTGIGSSGIVKLDGSGNQIQFYYDANFLPLGLAFTRSVASTYNFGGFLGSVNNAPTVNTGKAGKTYPVRWQLKNSSGAYITALSAVRSITYKSVACTDFGSSPTDPLDAAATGGTSLRYDTIANQYIYNWAAPATPGCYNLIVTLDTSQSFTAFFRLN